MTPCCWFMIMWRCFHYAQEACHINYNDRKWYNVGSDIYPLLACQCCNLCGVIIETISYATHIVILTGTGHFHYPVTQTSRTKFAFWSLFAIIVMAFYTSQLVAFLSIKHENLPFNDIKGLVNQSEYTWGISCDACVIRHVFEVIIN